MAKKSAARGLQSAAVRRYLTDVSRRTSLAPMSLAKGSAAKNIMLPMAMETQNIIITDEEKTLFALL